jgi:DNA-directed RNA polymerase specialized sigma24 family protein
LVYDRYALCFVRYLQQQGASEDVALDATQEVFVRLIVHRRQVRLADDGSLWPWLAVSGRNLVRDWQRRGVAEARARHRLGIVVAPDEAADALTRLEATGQRTPLRLARCVRKPGMSPLPMSVASTSRGGTPSRRNSARSASPLRTPSVER